MSGIRRAAAHILAFFALLAAIPAGQAQDIAPPNIGIVDVQRVLRDAQAAKSVLPEMERLRKSFQEQVKEQERTLRQAEQQLAQQRAILSREAFNEKRKAFAEQASTVQRQVQQRRRDLDEAFNATKNIILKNLIVVAQNVAEERKLDMIMEKRYVFISATALDITADVLAALNKRLPRVSIEFNDPGVVKGGPSDAR